jgi:hypothetical protein
MFAFVKKPHVCAWSNHAFEPRYDEVPTDIEVSRYMIWALSEKRLRSLMVRKVYVKDVCKHCGTTITR